MYVRRRWGPGIDFSDPKKVFESIDVDGVQERAPPLFTHAVEAHAMQSTRLEHEALARMLAQ
eukprot:285940-Pleurochrysis_carterae.AAC.1